LSKKKNKEIKFNTWKTYQDGKRAWKWINNSNKAGDFIKIYQDGEQLDWYWTRGLLNDKSDTGSVEELKGFAFKRWQAGDHLRQACKNIRGQAKAIDYAKFLGGMTRTNTVNTPRAHSRGVSNALKSIPEKERRVVADCIIYDKAVGRGNTILLRRGLDHLIKHYKL